MLHDQLAMGSSAVAEMVMTTLPSAAGAPIAGAPMVTVGACGGGGGGGAAGVVALPESEPMPPVALVAVAVTV